MSLETANAALYAFDSATLEALLPDLPETPAVVALLRKFDELKPLITAVKAENAEITPEQPDGAL